MLQVKLYDDFYFINDDLHDRNYAKSLTIDCHMQIIIDDVIFFDDFICPLELYFQYLDWKEIYDNGNINDFNYVSDDNGSNPILSFKFVNNKWKIESCFVKDVKVKMLTLEEVLTFFKEFEKQLFEHKKDKSIVSDNQVKLYYNRFYHGGITIIIIGLIASIIYFIKEGCSIESIPLMCVFALILSIPALFIFFDFKKHYIKNNQDDIEISYIPTDNIHSKTIKCSIKKTDILEVLIDKSTLIIITNKQRYEIKNFHLKMNLVEKVFPCIKRI